MLPTISDAIGSAYSCVRRTCDAFKNCRFPAVRPRWPQALKPVRHPPSPRLDKGPITALGLRYRAYDNPAITHSACRTDPLRHWPKPPGRGGISRSAICLLHVYNKTSEAPTGLKQNLMSTHASFVPRNPADVSSLKNIAHLFFPHGANKRAYPSRERIYMPTVYLRRATW